MAVSRHLNQTITVWRMSAVDSYGDPTFASPVQINGRWEQSDRLSRDNSGTEQSQFDTVYLDEDVSVGDYLFLGTSAASDPTSLDRAYRVEMFSKVPNLRNTDYERKAYL